MFCKTFLYHFAILLILFYFIFTFIVFIFLFFLPFPFRFVLHFISFFVCALFVAAGVLWAVTFEDNTCARYIYECVHFAELHISCLWFCTLFELAQRNIRRECLTCFCVLFSSNLPFFSELFWIAAKVLAEMELFFQILIQCEW